MATEILGFLIIVGILIVFIVRRDLWNGSASSSKAEEVEEASVKMRLQMEHSADAIITRMESHIHQLENLVAAADERARVLEQQLAAVREDQERAQRKAEQEFAAMRAAQQASYYPPREGAYPAGYGDEMRRQSWGEREDYRARMTRPQYSMQPIGGVSSVHRPEYSMRDRPDMRGRDDGFAEALSASMYAAQHTYGNLPQGEPTAYYEGARARRYPERYETAAYPAEPASPTETWEQYVEEPRRAALPRDDRTYQRAAAVPAEMVAEETPAVIVDSHMTERHDDYWHEEPEEEGPAFSQEQLEELAKTPAEVVVSSSVADVVDLPMEQEDAHAFAEAEGSEENEPAFDEAEAAEEGAQAFTEAEDADASEKARIYAAPDEADVSAEEDAPDLKPEEEPEISDDLDSGEEDRRLELADEEPAEFAKKEETLQAYAGEAAEPSIGDEEQQGEAPFARWDEAAQDGVWSGEEESEEPVDSVDEETEISAREVQSAVVNSDSSSPAQRARELLAQGMDPQDVARETGMGRGAVELLAQMVKSKSKPQED